MGRKIKNCELKTKKKSFQFDGRQSVKCISKLQRNSKLYLHIINTDFFKTKKSFPNKQLFPIVYAIVLR